MRTLWLALAVAFCSNTALAVDYVVVVSESNGWPDVVDELVKKHNAKVVRYDQTVTDSLAELTELKPRYTCFVARPTEVTRQFVADVHSLTRNYDDDPYSDTFWGILTGYDQAGALRIAKHARPLVVRKVASGTDIAWEMCQQGVAYDELVKNKMVRKQPGGKAIESKGPDDTTAALVAALNDYRADLFVTSGHATERDWMIGFGYRNGRFTSKAGQMVGLDTAGRTIEIDSPNPKVYLPIGNCLMGHIDGPDAMALAWMNDVGVHQMIGYTVPTWFGYMGWGCLDYFVEQPGRYTLAEAFRANHHALMHRLLGGFPELATAEVRPGAMVRPATVGQKAKAAGLTAMDGAGLLHDRDTVALYGDPKWSATMADAPKAWDQTLAELGGVYTFTIRPNRGANTFKPINTNGSQRGWRPIIHFFDDRLTDIELTEGADLEPVIADDFLLIPNPRHCDPARAYVVKFKARKTVNR